MYCGHNFLLKQRRTLVTTTRLFEYFLTAHRKFLDSFIKSFSSKHESLSEYSSCILVSFFFKSHFLLFLTYTLIGMACGHDSFTFIWLLPVRACSRYSKKNQLLWAVFRLVRRATTRHKNQIIYRENEKSWNLENEA